jgi:hypothetical protein
VSYLIEGTPLDFHEGVLVKREDLSCPPPGPPFAKTRGVYAHVAKRQEHFIGVLDTAHSQAGHAVAHACKVMGKTCLNFYPVYKREWIGTGPGELTDLEAFHALREYQKRARALGALLKPLPAGRSAILFHEAKKRLAEGFGAQGYMMPNALKLPEMVEEVAAEVRRTNVPKGLKAVVISISSGTIAAGVLRGLAELDAIPWKVILHMGYSRSHEEVRRYVREQSGVILHPERLELVDEGYSYGDEARPGVTPPFPCNTHYDLKAWRWLHREREGSKRLTQDILFWNIG